MSKTKRKRRQAAKRKRPGWWDTLGPAGRRKVVVRMTLGVTAVLGVCGAVLGAGWLEAHVLCSERCQQPAVIRLVDAPAELENELLAWLGDLKTAPWGERELCRQVGQALEENPWVKRVERVRKHGDGTMRIQCAYREPLTLVQIDSVFYLISEDRVRLPGTCAYDPQKIVVQGVTTPPPGPGERWEAPDLAAGLALVKTLDDEPFAHEITSVLVYNYGGREDNREAHLVLATDRPGGRILWGSAPGEEVEENTAAQKVAILRENERRFGRADANRQIIDVSLHPDRFLTPA